MLGSIVLCEILAAAGSRGLFNATFRLVNFRNTCWWTDSKMLSFGLQSLWFSEFRELVIALSCPLNVTEKRDDTVNILSKVTGLVNPKPGFHLGLPLDADSPGSLLNSLNSSTKAVSGLQCSGVVCLFLRLQWAAASVTGATLGSLWSALSGIILFHCSILLINNYRRDNVDKFVIYFYYCYCVFVCVCVRQRERERLIFIQIWGHSNNEIRAHLSFLPT